MSLSRFVGWLTLTHTQRWHAHRQSTGSGHLYQGRFKSFPVQDDDHFLTVCRYVERNALRAEDWRWSSLYRWCSGTAAQKELLSAWPLRRAAGWLEHVNSARRPDQAQRRSGNVVRISQLRPTQNSRRSVAASIETRRLAMKHGRPQRPENSAWKSPPASREGRKSTKAVPDIFCVFSA
ncbi:MAG: hypothetical protein R3C17_21935 [Planctomycetaceae bacterium]